MIPAGAFTMGSDDGDEDERPPHVVHLDDVSDRRAAGHQRRVRPVRPRDGPPRAGTCTSCRWSSRPADSEREDVFPPDERAPTSGTDGSPAARTARSPGDARALGRRRRVLRLAVGGDRTQRSVCPPRRNGRRLPRRSARQALSLGRALRSQPWRISSRIRAKRANTARRRAAPIRRTATASSTWPATSGSGCTTGMRPDATTRRRRARTRPGRRGTSARSSAAAAGSWRTSGC